MEERDTVSSVWGEALAIVWRYPLVTLVPAVVLAALADVPYYFLKGSGIGWEEILTFVTAAFAYYLYVAYAEEVAVEAQRGKVHITARGMPPWWCPIALKAATKEPSWRRSTTISESDSSMQ